MSKSIVNKTRILTLATGIILAAVANGASAHDFGGGNSGHGGSGGGGAHYDHVFGGRDSDRGGGYDHGSYDGHRGGYDTRKGYHRSGGYDTSGGIDHSGSYGKSGGDHGSMSSADKAKAGNSGVYCQFCVGQRTPAPVPDPTENHKG